MKALTRRFTTGWSLTRVLFTVIGGYMIADAVVTHTWFALLPGGWFFAMGLLGFGCASGNCAVPPPDKKS